MTRRTVALTSVLLFTCLLFGCGGGTGSAATTPEGVQLASVVAKNKIAAVATSATETSGSAAADTWIPCANENADCAFSGLRQVRYGIEGHYVVLDETGPAHCNNQTFGDPAVGVVKSCAYSSAAWVSCAAEGGTCRFDGTRQVRYGMVGTYVVQQAVDAIACSNSVFGDPLVGVVKSCWYEATGTDVAGEPPGTDPCESLPALPSLPASYNVVTSFCASGRCVRPDDGLDDTDAIQQALDASAGRFLVFPPGQYLISRSLRVRQGGVTLWGPGATIHATNWDDQSIVIEADNTSIYSFRLTAVTRQRGSRAEHTRVAIYGPAGLNPVVKSTIIRNNQIVNAGEPGTELANAATGAGIFVNAADGFLIAGNTVARTLADGIHVTGGARNGRIVGNVVRETGDDMIAMVSYAYPDPNANVAATIAAGFASHLETYSDRDILVAGNVLSGQYWGRGIAVVGGRNITIRGNTLANLPYGAAILLAREPQSGTYGVSNVVVANNSISDEQTLAPPYDFGGKFAANARTGHGAIEIESAYFADELLYPEMISGFAVKDLLIEGNTVSVSATPAMRSGIGTGAAWAIGTRQVTGGSGPASVSIDGNALARIQSESPIQIVGGSATCSANSNDGRAMTTQRCAPVAPTTVPQGANLSCSQH